MQDQETRRRSWSKRALLAFGGGLLLGLAAVATEVALLGYLASGLMALGIAALPVAMLADWRRATRSAPAAAPRPAPRRGKRPATPKKPPAATRRPRAPARPKR